MNRGSESAGEPAAATSRSEGGTAIELVGVRFAHPGQRVALAVDDLRCAAGSRTAVIGPSGSGKTTLLHLIAGILLPDRGEVRVGGRAISGESERARRRFRIERIGLIFQEFELLEHLTVAENIALPFAIDPRLARDGGRDRVAPLAARLGIGELLDRRPRKLSHGERQRVAIARALVVGPSVLLADEPTGNLDPRTGDEVLDSLFEEAERHGTTVVMVTHDHSHLERLDRTIDLAEWLDAAGSGGEEAA